MGALDRNVSVQVLIQNPPVQGTNFGVPMFLGAPSSFGVGFTERVRAYATADAVDTDVDAGDITAAFGDRLKLALTQTPRVDQILAGRLEAGANALEVTVTWTGNTTAAGETFTVRCGTAEFTYTSLAAAETPAVISAAIAAGLAPLLVSEGVPATVTDNTGSITLEGATVNDSFGYSATVTSPSVTVATAVVDAGIDIPTNLAAIRAENDAWYGLATELRARVSLEAIAANIEALGAAPTAPVYKLFLPQSSDADLLVAGISTDLASFFQSLNYRRTNLMYRSSDDLDIALATLATKLETNLDLETTDWAYTTLEGVAPQVLTATQLDTVEAKRFSYYGEFYGQGATWRHVLPNGNYVDERTTADWTADRSATALATAILNANNRNSKIPYTDRGIAVLAGQVRGIGKQGEAAGHYVVDSFVVTKPLASEVPPALKADRCLVLSFSGTLQGAIQKVDVTGYVGVAV